MIVSKRMCLTEHPNYKEMEDYITNNYKYYYENKRDGNCFYYSFIVTFLNQIKVMNEKEYKRILNILIESNQQVRKFKSKDITFEDFYEITIDNVVKIRKTRIEYVKDDMIDSKEDSLLEINKIEEDEIDFSNVDFNEMTAYFKILISTQLKSNEAKYAPFIDVARLATLVESFYKETGHVEISALSDFLKIGIKIVSTFEPKSIHYGDMSTYVTILFTHNHFEPLK